MDARSPKRPDILEQWSRLPVPADLPARSGPARDRVVDAVVRTMLSPKIRTPNRPGLALRAGLGTTAATALIAAIVIGHSWSAKEPLIPRAYLQSNSGEGVVQGPPFESPSESSSTLTLDSSSRLQLVNGVEVVVGPETRLALPGEKDARGELALESGTLQAHVPTLPKGAVFAVRTPNALVSAHDSAFSVEVSPLGPSEVRQTRVIVTEGVVAVQHAGHELVLDAGTEWTSSVANPPVRGAEREPATAFKRLNARKARGAAGATSDPNELANQNRLFSEAMGARDRGDAARAVTLLDNFIVKYPACPLAEDAHIARFRVLEQGDRGAAAKAARSYLAVYPEGLAGEEARALATGR